MVQAGADAIVVFPISPTGLNNAVKAVCAKGVIIIAYAANIDDPCAYIVTMDEKQVGPVTGQWLVDELHGKGRIVLVTGVAGTSVNSDRTSGAKAIFAKYPDIKIIAEVNGNWSQATARQELAKVVSTHGWDGIDGLWMQVGCYTAADMQCTDSRKGRETIAGESTNGHRLQMLPAGTVKGEGSTSDRLPQHFIRLTALFGCILVENRRRYAPGQQTSSPDPFPFRLPGSARWLCARKVPGRNGRRPAATSFRRIGSHRAGSRRFLGMKRPRSASRRPRTRSPSRNISHPLVEAGADPSRHRREVAYKMPELKSAAIALELAAVTKHYGATIGLDGASFAVRLGSVHALLGENGAGKSTVVKLLSGLLRSDTGEILVRGKPAPIRSPNVAHKLGIQTAFQELSLLPNLSVAKNILLPYEPVSSIRLLRPREARRQAEAIMAKFGIDDIDPGAQVGELDLPVRQKIEIVGAICREPDILLLDEPTSALSASDVEWLFDLVKAATANGTTVLFISHRLQESGRCATPRRSCVTVATSAPSAPKTFLMTRSFVS